MAFRETLWRRLLAVEREMLRGAAAGVVMLLLGWFALNYFLRENSPEAPVAEASAPRPQADTAASAHAAAIAEVERDYRQKVDAGSGRAVMAQWVETEIVRRNSLLRTLPESEISTEQTRLAWLENKRGLLQAATDSEHSTALERDAATARQAGRTDAAQGALQEALRLQRAANRQQAAGHASDLEREARLTQEVMSSDAEPAEREIVTLLREAETNPPRALEALRTAAERQHALNDKFAGTPFENLARLKQIQTMIASAEAAPLASAVEAAEQAAAAATKSGRTDRAAAAYEEAARLQAQINEKNPDSKFADAVRAAKFEQQRQAALATDLSAQVLERDREATALLRQGDTVAALEKNRAASALLERVMREFPLAAGELGAVRTRLDFIWLQRSELTRLSEQVFQNLAPISPDTTARMLRTEITQALYAQVMNDNPSATADLRLPVDTVTWHEARAFCERIFWLLGRSVRLPTREEFLTAAAGAKWSRSADNAAGHSWPAGSSPQPREVFQDLLGNVGEWLQPELADGPLAHVAGGSYLDRSTVSAPATFTITDKNKRASHVGFRIVVE